MLIIALLVAFLFYVGLFLLWESASVNLSGPLGVLWTLNRMLFMPTESVLMILRGLIFITALYVVADFLLSSTRRGLKRKANARKSVVHWKKPKMI